MSLQIIQSTWQKPSRALIAALLFGAAAGVGGTAWALSSAPAPGPITVAPTNPQPGFSQLVARVKPAVVEITTISSGDAEDGNGDAQPSAREQMPDMPKPFADMFRQYFDGQRHAPSMERRALGSGFIIDPAGYIVTNNHVVDSARQVSVKLMDGSKYKATVIGRDAKTDLALLKIESSHALPYVAFGDSDRAHEGDWVVAVGNPYGLGGTVTAGIVSAHGRNINEGPYDDFLQIDAPINPGNSGGPLFNQTGQVVGIDTAIYSPSGGSVGIGFAIPSNIARTIVADLRAHGKVTRGWLGVQMQALTPALAKAVGLSSDQGVLVDQVTDGSPASRAGLKQGDVITAFNGKPIHDSRSLAMAVAGTPSGKSVAVAVWRDSRSRTIDVTIGAPEGAQLTSATDSSQSEKPVGLSLGPLNSDTRERLGLDAEVSGVVVIQVSPGSNADESGVQSGDVIERVGDKTVASPAEVASAIHSAERQKREAISLLVLRNGVSSYLGLELPA